MASLTGSNAPEPIKAHGFPATAWRPTNDTFGCRKRQQNELRTNCGGRIKCQGMRAVAIKKGQTREKAPAFKEMGTLRCDGCGEEFIVFHDPTFVDKAAAERQAQWLDRVLAEEHERERKHPDRIELPDW